MAQIYEVLVKNVSYDRAFVLAENTEEAREKVQTLCDNGTLECDYGYDQGDRFPDDVGEPKDLEPEERAMAEANEREYKEITSQE